MIKFVCSNTYPGMYVRGFFVFKSENKFGYYKEKSYKLDKRIIQVKTQNVRLFYKYIKLMGEDYG